MLARVAGLGLIRSAAGAERWAGLRMQQRMWQSSDSDDYDERDDFSSAVSKQLSQPDEPTDFEDEGKRKIFVGNLAWVTDEHSLTRKFSAMGHIVDAHIVRNAHDQRSRGFGFITFGDEASAERALREMESVNVDGRDVRVQPARKREPRQMGYNRPFPNEH